MENNSGCADHDLAQRSIYGGFVYLGFLAALLVSTDYFSSHPALVTLAGATTLVCASGRYALARYFGSLHPSSPRVWRGAMFLAININSFIWGLFLVETLFLYGYEDWKTLLLLICLAGTAPIALASMAPNVVVLRTFLTAFTMPMILANLYLGGRRGYTMASIFAWYLLFTMLHAQRMSREYRAARERTAALDAARKSAEASSRAKSEFLANMSHELRTPMTVIMGMTDLALNSNLGSEQREYLNAVKTSCDLLLGSLNELLDFSKIEAGKVRLESIPFSLRRLLSETLDPFGAAARARGLTLRHEVRTGVPDLLQGDPARLRQVLMNIVGNAVKFTERGEIRAEVTLEEEPRPGVPVTLRFGVSDTGIGIPPGKQQSIFEAFEQADSSTSRKHGGTGLGLTIASRIVQMMEGRIWVESQSDRGSSFYWTSRFGWTDAPVVPEAAAQPAPAATRQLRILVAEDHAMSRRMLERLLEERGYQVHGVSSGLDVLSVLEARTFDLILMDVRMPGLDGVATTAAIRRRERASGTRLPIIALTAHTIEGVREQLLSAGMDGCLAKPIQADRLFEAIEKFGSPAA